MRGDPPSFSDILLLLLLSPDVWFLTLEDISDTAEDLFLDSMEGGAVNFLETTPLFWTTTASSRSRLASMEWEGLGDSGTERERERRGRKRWAVLNAASINVSPTPLDPLITSFKKPQFFKHKQANKNSKVLFKKNLTFRFHP